MKNLIFLLVLITGSAFASDLKFNCTGPDDTQEFILNENHVTFRGVTFTNMLPVNMEMDYRGYSFINNPWMSVLITSPMLNGQEGYVEFMVTDLSTYEVNQTYYNCQFVE